MNKQKTIIYSIFGIGVAAMLILIGMVGYALVNQAREPSISKPTIVADKANAVVMPKPNTVSLNAIELIGSWEADDQLTRWCPCNEGVDKDDLESSSWLWAIQLKQAITFQEDGKFIYDSSRDQSAFTYQVLKRHDNVITIRSEIIVSQDIRDAAPPNSFQPFEVQWKIMDDGLIAQLMQAEKGTFWLVYKRVK